MPRISKFCRYYQLSKDFLSKDMDLITKGHPVQATQGGGRREKQHERHLCTAASKGKGGHINDSHSQTWGAAVVFHHLWGRPSARPRGPVSEPTGEAPGTRSMPLVTAGIAATFSQPRKFEVAVNCWQSSYAETAGRSSWGVQECQGQVPLLTSVGWPSTRDIDSPTGHHSHRTPTLKHVNRYEGKIKMKCSLVGYIWKVLT